jgi:hypothetical protein
MVKIRLKSSWCIFNKNNMKNLQKAYLLLPALLVFVSGCEIVGGIFKAGVWVGVLIVGFVLLLIIVAASWMKKK